MSRGLREECIDNSATVPPRSATPEPLECGYFTQCVEDAGHDGPHHTDMYPEWEVPTIEPMAFIAPPDDGCDFIAYNYRCINVKGHEGPHRPMLWGGTDG